MKRRALKNSWNRRVISAGLCRCFLHKRRRGKAAAMDAASRRDVVRGTSRSNFSLSLSRSLSLTLSLSLSLSRIEAVKPRHRFRISPWRISHSRSRERGTEMGGRGGGGGGGNCLKGSTTRGMLSSRASFYCLAADEGPVLFLFSLLIFLRHSSSFDIAPYIASFHPPAPFPGAFSLLSHLEDETEAPR